jgi:hypothetical protein
LEQAINHQEFRDLWHDTLLAVRLRIPYPIGAPLQTGQMNRFPKLFDLVPPDDVIVSDGKYYNFANGMNLSPAMFSMIAEHIGADEFCA